MTDRIYYVYGVVPVELDAAGAPPGLDEAPVFLVREGTIAALVSLLESAQYQAHSVEDRIADLAWLGPRAVAHDRVLTWASDAGAVVPFPMFSLFRDEERVRGMLRERSEALQRKIERVAPAQEYTLRLFRLDERLHESMAALSPRIASLEEAAAQASPGQRYLLARKVEGEKKLEAERVAAEVAKEVLDALSARSIAAVRDTLPARRDDDAPGTAILNASFLVPRTGLDPFRKELTALLERYEPFGFRAEFTGPWPPFHFVEDDA